jgi:transposase
MLLAAEPESGDKPQNSGKRQYSVAFKRKVVRLSFAPGSSVSVVSRRYDINSNILFRWRREYRQGKFGGFEIAAPVLPAQEFIAVGSTDHAGSIVPGLPSISKPVASAPIVAAGKELSVIEIETAAGVKLRLVGRVDDRALRRVLAAIRRLG